MLEVTGVRNQASEKAISGAFEGPPVQVPGPFRVLAGIFGFQRQMQKPVLKALGATHFSRGMLRTKVVGDLRQFPFFNGFLEIAVFYRRNGLAGIALVG